jgi:diguanylate cyclase (GGDEF)-like protein
MRFDRRIARQLAPFGAATLLGFAVVPIDNQVAWTPYGLAVALIAGPACATVLTPSSKVRVPRIVPSLLFLVGLALLRDAGGGAAAGVGALGALPVFWLALHGTRGELLIMIACVCAFFAAPALVVGGAEYPIGTWKIAVVFAGAAALVGVTVHSLVARVRSQAAGLALRERDLEAVAELARDLSGAPDSRERICRAACELSGAHFAVLMEGQTDGTLASSAEAGMSPPAQAFTAEPARSWAMKAHTSRAEHLVPDLGAQSGVPPSLAATATLLLEPVCRGGDAAGVLAVGWRERPSDPARMTGLVRLLAAEAAFVIERADLLGRLTEMALTDMLTGLPNRRAWEARLEQAIAGDEPICVAILDLDFFKAYNDDHGHQNGDRLLKEAAAAWRAQLRSTDMLARYGGEEFVALLHGGDVNSARRVVERLRAATPRAQSCSAGLALREPGEGGAALLARADEALYRAKRGGRDRCLVARSDAPGALAGRA